MKGQQLRYHITPLHETSHAISTANWGMYMYQLVHDIVQDSLCVHVTSLSKLWQGLVCVCVCVSRCACVRACVSATPASEALHLEWSTTQKELGRGGRGCR